MIHHLRKRLRNILLVNISTSMFKNPDLFWSQFSDISTEKAVQLQKWGFLKDTFACHH